MKCVGKDTVTSSAAAASSISGAPRPNAIDGVQTLRTELELARASQLTLLRLQLALHKSNHRVAMQALDDLLDIDAEMEGLAATLGGVAAHPTSEGDATLAGFIGLQKAAITAEKHALTGGNLRGAAPVAAPVHDDAIAAADFPAQEDEESDDRTRSRRWMIVLAAAIIVTVLGYGLIAWLLPALSVTRP